MKSFVFLNYDQGEKERKENSSEYNFPQRILLQNENSRKKHIKQVNQCTPFKVQLLHVHS